METTLYDDHSRMSEKEVLKGAMNKLKSQMTLDFNNGPPAKKRALGQILASPDLNMLKLASPELERMIIQHNGLVTTTPTPTQVLFPKAVTEEQEAYARGFMDALAKLHDNETDNTDASKDSIPSSYEQDVKPDTTYATLQNASTRLMNLPTTTVGAIDFASTSVPGRVTTSSVDPAVYSTINTSTPLLIQPTRTASPYEVQSNSRSHVMQLKEEPQTVPSLESTPPMSPNMLSPINMDDQEQIKLDRKRARNRVAARKCRYRKLERIARLEDRVNELKSQNSKLSGDATALKEQVLRLKQQILEHVNSGCNIMMSGLL